MSEPIGETFVTITPLVNPAEFKAEAEKQIKAAVANVTVPLSAGGGAPPGTPPDKVKTATAAFKEYEAALVDAAAAQDKATLASAKSLVGLGTKEEAVALDIAGAQAALRLAEADVKLTIATGVQSDTFKASVAALTARDIALLRDTEVTNQNTAAQHASRASLRRQVEQVLTGHQSLGSLVSGSNILKLGAGTLAFGAIIEGAQHLAEALKVDGDEAFTTEGKFRNFGAELLKGDVVGGLIALNAHAKSAGEQLKELRADEKTSIETLTIFADKTDAAATKQEKYAAALKILGDDHSALGRAVTKAAEETRKAADDARDYAAALLTAAQAAQDMAAQVAHAGSEAAQFGEQVRGTGGVPNILTPQGATGTEVDSTATTANQNAIREANAKTLQDRLTVANDERKQLLERIALAQKATGKEGLTALKVAEAQKRKEIRGIEKEIADADEAERKRLAAEEKKRRDDAEAEAKRRAAEAAKALRDSLTFSENELKDRLAAAQGGSLAAQRRALIALIAFNKAESENRRLDKLERQRALIEARQYQRDLTQLNKDGLAAALGVREQNLRNAIEAAKLTSTTADDTKADAAFLKFLQNQVKRARGDAAALADARAALIAFQLELKGQHSASSFSLEDLFKTAQDQFDQFGSNVSAQVTTGADVRGAFAGGILGQNPKITPGQQAQLTEAQRTNQLLTGILGAVTRSGQGGRDRTTTNELATPGTRTAAQTAKLIGLIG